MRDNLQQPVKKEEHPVVEVNMTSETAVAVNQVVQALTVPLSENQQRLAEELT